MKIEVTDIKWDTDGEDVELPANDVIEIPDYKLTDDDLEEIISDRITEIYGFCHKGFSWERC